MYRYYICGILIIRGFLQSLVHIFIKMTNYLKSVVHFPADIKQFQPKQELRA